ncbi:MAG: hypothetical protein QOE76_936 [Frankiales bacterium]|jgi:uncharacterized protein (DUF885 family)|nr:hypothetical protein [Frankiales bacterium]
MSTIAELSDELLHLFLLASPIDGSLLGLPGYDSLLPDLSVAGRQRLQGELLTLIARLDGLVAAGPEEQLEIDVVREFATGARDRTDANLDEIMVTDYFTAPVGSLLSFLPQIVLSTPAQAAGYLDRLRAVPDYLAGASEQMVAGTAAGRTAVAHLAQRTVEQVDRYLADPEHDPLLGPPAPADWDGADGFDAERRRLLAEVVRPAMAGYRDAIVSQVLPKARPADKPGLVWVPGGDATYEAMLRFHTTTTHTPQEIHQLGLDAVARLAEEYAEVGERVFGTREPSEVFRLLRADPALRWNDGDEILGSAEAAIRRAEDAAPQWFGVTPVQRCAVAPVPADQAPQAPAAYYFAPALDGSRPGTYYANTFEPQERFRFESEAIAYHEAVPGHHLQLSLVQEIDLSRLRQVYTVTAYAEGWGLYAERLAEEMGLYSDDVSRLGMLSADSMRAARLVVDTGLHALGWSRERAVAFCRDNTPMAGADIEVEIDRYISDPGQACAYMVGRLEIQRVRALAEARLGDRFDIRGFHDAVLGVGGVPLGLLERVVTTWCDTVPA